MRLLHLRYALQVAKSGSINQAAKILYVTQPYLSKSIKDLEAELGFPVFVRSSHGVEITEEGQQFLNDAAMLLQQVELMEQLYNHKSAHTQTFEIASIRTAISMQAYISFYCKFYEQTPSFKFRFIETNLFSVVDAVSRNEARLGVLLYFEGQEEYLKTYVNLHNLELFHLGGLPLYITFSSNHPLAGCDAVYPEQLAGYPCLTYSDYVGPILNMANQCRLAGINPPEQQIYVHDRHTLMHTLSQTNAYAIGHHYSPEDLSFYGLKSVSLPGAQKSICFGYLKVCNRTFSSQSLEHAFVETLKQTLVQFKNL